MKKTFPFDDDGAVLRSLQKKGVNLDLPRDIDFYCYASSLEIANQIAICLDAMGFKSRIFQDDEADRTDERISVYSTKWMIPDYELLIRTQAELNAVLLPFGTHCDGWGTLVDPKETSQVLH